MGRGNNSRSIFSGKGKRHPVRAFFIWSLLILLTLCLVIAVMNFGTNTQIHIARETVTVWNLPKALDGFTILHISDLHGVRFRDGQAGLGKALEGLYYKAVVITGDMVGKRGDHLPFMELLKVLNPEAPVFFIAGDEDPAPLLYEAHGSPEPLNAYIIGAMEQGAVYVDAPVSLEVDRSVIWFCPENQYGLDAVSQARAFAAQRDHIVASGLKDTPDGAAGIRALEYRIDTMNRLALARTLMDEADYQIVLAHQPLTDAYFYEMDIYQSEEVMSLSHAILALSGHYCGGQWRLPWTDRALYVPGLGYQPEERQYVGLSRPGGLTQYISPGLGAAGFYRFQPGRLYNPPAVTLITLSGR